MILSADLPADNNGNWVGPDVGIRFSTPMDQVATAEALTMSPKITYVILWEQNNTRMVIHPLANWAIKTEYSVMIATTARSTGGLHMNEDYIVNFDIKQRPISPIVISTEPAHEQQDVHPEAIIRIRFSKPMDTYATEQALVIVPNTDMSQGYAIKWDENNQRLSFYFAQNMRPGEVYYVRITSNAMSADGVYMERAYTFFFDVMAC